MSSAIELGGTSALVGSISDAVRMLPALSAPPVEWALLLLLPLAAGLIAMLTARITVLRALARMP